MTNTVEKGESKRKSYKTQEKRISMKTPAADENRRENVSDEKEGGKVRGERGTLVSKGPLEKKCIPLVGLHGDVKVNPNQ